MKLEFVSDTVTNEDGTTLKTKIEKILSDILSDKHEARITLKFVKHDENDITTS